MRLEFEETAEFPNVVVTLSRRNLRTLLTKLNDPDSVRTLTLNRIPELGYLLTVRAEEDDVHYVNEERRSAGAFGRPGQVLDRTLVAMDAIEESEGITPKKEAI